MVRRFFWALTARFTRAMGWCSLSRSGKRDSKMRAASAVQHLLDALGVVGRHLGAALESTGASARLVLKQVTAVGLLAQDLAGGGAAEPFGGTAVGLGLGHLSSVL